MRIICNQCGHSIHSATCAKYCDQEKRQKQYDEAVKAFNIIADKIINKRHKNENI